MYNCRIYIPFGRNITLLNKAIASIVPQINEHSSFAGKKIVVINNTLSPIEHLLEFPDMTDVWQLPFEITQAQEANWMIRAAIENNEPFCMTTHTDSELLPGAMEAMFRTYEKIKNDRWSVIGSAVWHTVFCLYNPKFFIEEDVWFDTFLFPFYFMDNHMGRLMTLRNWPGFWADCPEPIITHVKSHIIAEDAIFRKKNDIAFKYHQKIYGEIWDGFPGYEKSMDPYAKGTLPV